VLLALRAHFTAGGLLALGATIYTFDIERDLTGALQVWVDIGLPEPERLHRASKAAPRVAVYTHKDPEQWAVKLAAAKIHRGEKIAVFAFDRVWQTSQTVLARLGTR